VEMIFHPVNSVEVTIFIREELVDISKKSAAFPFQQSRFTMFGRKNDMVDQLGVCAHKNQDKV